MSKNPASAVARIFAKWIIVCWTLLAPVAHADGPALDIQSIQGGSDITNGSFSLGWNFTLNSSISVTALGFYDDGKNGLVESHDVGIYDAGCNLVASTTVTNADALNGFFRYHNLASAVTLAPGQTYTIAAVTGTEKYLYNPAAVVLDPAVNFGKFNAWQGAFQQTATLKCPNFPASSQFYGDFGPSFYIGNSSNDPLKRASALAVFCNRTGTGLKSASCTATVADQGAPPRIQPTGSVNWEARDGFTPESAECQPIQVAGSPGVSSCDVTFTVPEGFPIGVKFPIDATYSGDSNFDLSSTSHKLIIPQCASTDPAKPCPNSIGLGFTGSPQVLKERIKAFLQCGSQSAGLVKAHDTVYARDKGSGSSCSALGTVGVSAADLFKALDLDAAKALGQVISNKEGMEDNLLYLFKNAYQLNADEWKRIQTTNPILDAIVDDIIKNKASVRRDGAPFSKYLQIGQLQVRASNKSVKKFDKSFKSEKVTVEVKPDSQKNLTFKLPTRAKTLISVMKKAGISTLPVEISLTATQKNRKGKATITEIVDVIIK